MAGGGDEIEIAANAGLGRMHVAKVVSTINNPEFFIPGGEIENLFVLWENDERRKAELGAHGDNVFPAVLDDASPSPAARAKTYGPLTAERTPSARAQRMLRREVGSTCICRSLLGNVSSKGTEQAPHREQHPPSLARKRLARSRLRSGQHFQTFGKAEGLEGFPAFAVVIGIVGVEPVALRIHGEIGDLADSGVLIRNCCLGMSPAIKAVSVSFK